MTLLLLLNILFYLFSAGLLWRSMAKTAQTNWVLWAVPLTAIILHSALLWRYLANDHFDHLNITTSLSTVALLLAVLTLLRSRTASGLLLSPIIYVFAAVTIVILVFSPANWGAPLSDTSGLVIHIILSLLAYAILMLATLYAVQILYLNYVLKHHRTNTFAGYLPPLMTAERYFFRLLSSGTLMLAIAIASGFIFLNDMLAQGQAHKTILSLVAFLLYAIVIFLHAARQVRGRALVVTSVVASAVLTLAYFGSKFVKDVLLSL